MRLHEYFHHESLLIAGGGDHDAPAALREGARHRREPARQVRHGLRHHGPFPHPWYFNTIIEWKKVF